MAKRSRAKPGRKPQKRHAIVVRPRAADDLDAIWSYIAADAPVNAARFLGTLLAAIDGLEHFPEKCPIAPESEAFGLAIRHRLVGRYRILFTIDGRTVRVVRVRSSFQRTLTPEDDPLKG